MSSAPGSAASIPHCALHPEVPARTICERCGGFCCEGCVSEVLGRTYCAACAVLPEVNYLETLRLKFWGRRDVWAWLLGLWGLLGLYVGAMACRSGEWKRGGVMLAQAGVSLGCFLRQRWARWGLLGLPAGVGLWLAMGRRPFEALPALLLLCFWAAIFVDTRNRLFFRLPVSERALRRLWDRYENNPLARAALSVGLLGVLLPPLALLAVILGGVGLRRVDPQAHPPIGRKAHAVVGLVLGAASLTLWTVVLGPRFLEWLQALI